jgi:hypothetical protein
LSVAWRVIHSAIPRATPERQTSSGAPGRVRATEGPFLTTAISFSK